MYVCDIYKPDELAEWSKPLASESMGPGSSLAPAGNWVYVHKVGIALL